jgi:hypothetical protein
VGGGQTTITGNVFDHLVIEIDDTTGLDHPVLLGLNALNQSRVEVKRGRLVRVRGEE